MTFDFIPIIDELIADIFIFYLLLDLSCKLLGLVSQPRQRDRKRAADIIIHCLGNGRKKGLNTHKEINDHDANVYIFYQINIQNTNFTQIVVIIKYL